jgi:DNA-binding NarL/FixJ family response regulator
MVEDDAGVPATLANLINGSPGFRCLSQHATAENALQEIPKANPNVVLMDINLPGLSGVDCVRRLKPLLPQTQIIMLTVYQNTEHIFNALAAGASGYLLKPTRNSMSAPAPRRWPSTLARGAPHAAFGERLRRPGLARHRLSPHYSQHRQNWRWQGLSDFDITVRDAVLYFGEDSSSSSARRGSIVISEASPRR